MIFFKSYYIQMSNLAEMLDTCIFFLMLKLWKQNVNKIVVVHFSSYEWMSEFEKEKEKNSRFILAK